MVLETTQLIAIAGAGLSATIDPLGAQLMSLRTASGVDLLWQGDPAIWPDRAPILFPIIGPVTNGRIYHDGNSWPMPAHGFARTSEFTVAEQDVDTCRLELHASEQTRMYYPFDFDLRITFEVFHETFGITLSVTNPGPVSLPVDAGFHPGFNWPLVSDRARDDHVIVFAEQEPAPVRRGVDDPIFLRPDSQETPVDGNLLRLRDDLFRDNAIVFDRLMSRSVTYRSTGTGGGPELRIAFPDSPFLALWSRPGAGFVAIEPWLGLPSPVGFTGPLEAKPGIGLIPPGATRNWHMFVTWIEVREER